MSQKVDECEPLTRGCGVVGTIRLLKGHYLVLITRRVLLGRAVRADPRLTPGFPLVDPGLSELGLSD
jgi:hypothetical protein